MTVSKAPTGIESAFRNLEYERELDRIKRSMATSSSGGPLAAVAMWSGFGTQTLVTGAWKTLVPAQPTTISNAGDFIVGADGSIKPKYAGWYHIAASVYFVDAAVAHCTIGGNPNDVNYSGEAYDGSASGGKILTPEATMRLTANQAVYVTASGGGTNGALIRELALTLVGGPTGPQGPPGTPGMPGAPGAGGDLAYVHTQGAASASWVVPHNLNKFPSVSVVDSGGSVVLPDVLYTDANHVTVQFGSATSGKAYCN
jgi:hypothetical protein